MLEVGREHYNELMSSLLNVIFGLLVIIELILQK